jgi:hypothetical protein
MEDLCGTINANGHFKIVCAKHLTEIEEQALTDVTKIWIHKIGLDKKASAATSQASITSMNSVLPEIFDEFQALRQQY